jgi:hypothetical protein
VRRWTKLAVCLSITLGLASLAWISALLELQGAERHFREVFVPGKESYPVWSEYECATCFGGHAGVSRLRMLSQDPSLPAGARWVADQTVVYIESGRYLREIEMTEEMGPFFDRPIFQMELRCLQIRESLLSVFR